jgi:hypothetical protein
VTGDMLALPCHGLCSGPTVVGSLRKASLTTTPSVQVNWNTRPMLGTRALFRVEAVEAGDNKRVSEMDHRCQMLDMNFRCQISHGSQGRKTSSSVFFCRVIIRARCFHSLPVSRDFDFDFDPAWTALLLDLPRGLYRGESLPASRRISPNDLQTVRCPRHEPSRDYIALELWELRYRSFVERRLSDVVEHSCTEQLY